MSNCVHRNIIRIAQNFKCGLRLSKYTIHIKFAQNIPHKIPSPNICHVSKNFSQNRNNSSLNDGLYEKICRETLESLTEFFEELQEEHVEFTKADISYNDGVLTIAFGQKFGTYVINRQLPNKQIWLSSPVSGPKRYDYENGGWIYKHNNRTLHSLLQEELSQLLNKPIDLSQCLHYKS